MSERTTIRMPGAMLVAAKRRAAEQGRTLTDLILHAVRCELAKPPETPAPVSLPIATGSGLRPGVDINNSRALLDLMDEL